MMRPQYFDGKGWKNETSTKFGINSIPRMWLVDKKGNLADLNARQDLAGKVREATRTVAHLPDPRPSARLPGFHHLPSPFGPD